MKYSLLIVFLFQSLISLAQNSVVTDFKESHSTALSLYFYPSTLRMVNLERNEEFDEMIREVKKARFFKMDSAAVSNDDLKQLSSELTEDGFEEIMFLKNREMDIRVWGLEKRIPETIIISKSGYEVMLLEVNGMINVAKIPKIMESFSENSFLDVLNLKPQ